MADNPLTLKGHEFTEASPFMPRSVRQGSPERRQAWLDDQNERWKIVDICRDCKPPRPLVAEERMSHRLNHVPERLRPLARDIAALPHADRLDLIGLFDASTGRFDNAE